MRTTDVLVAAVLAVLAVPGCGRIGFDAGGATMGDGSVTDDGPPALSCGELAPSCGPTSSSPCCESPLVTGGTFARSHDVSGDGMYQDSSYTATLGDFRLDKYEVTVGRFRQFVMAGQGTQTTPPVVGAGAHPNIASSGWDASWNANLKADTASLVGAVKCNATYATWTDAAAGNENRPMSCVSWYEAMAFCAWDRGFLPSEAEWNYAASGGGEQRAFPWSSPAAFLGIDGTRASYYDVTTQCVGDGVNGCALTDLIAVGTKPAGDGRWGQSDLGGNVWEWTLDWYASPYPQNPCNNCANLASGMSRVIRGGGFNDSVAEQRAGIRVNWTPEVRSYGIGFRCARTL